MVAVDAAFLEPTTGWQGQEVAVTGLLRPPGISQSARGLHRASEQLLAGLVTAQLPEQRMSAEELPRTSLCPRRRGLEEVGGSRLAHPLWCPRRGEHSVNLSK